MRYEETVGYVSKILAEYTMRLTLRQIYYRLVADFGLPNKRSSYNQLSRHLVKAREQGVISEAYVSDYGNECWELDAIDPTTLQDMVVKAIEERIDLDKWEESEDRLEDERAEVKETIAKWNKAIEEVD